MENRNLFSVLGFAPKENTSGILTKKYEDGYIIEIDENEQIINYGEKIKSDSKTTQNFSQAENFVVLECVNRLLEKGYKPENIILEKTYPSGHGTSGRLDICVNREDDSEYLLIECKTFGNEFNKEFIRMKKDGGQLFTYFKFSNKPDVIMLYASEINGKGIVYRNEIVKIEDNYRTGDKDDFYEKWNKLTKDNGVFDDWVKPYNFESKALTINELEEIKPEDSSFIFNRFLEILRHNVVSDKGNAFNKIFTLFLCKIYDEKTNEETNNELGFQWLEGKDNEVDFQLRLTDLYKRGMEKFLEKKVTDFSEEQFDNEYHQLLSFDNDLSKKLKNEINRLRLEKNNEFAIKEVYDKKSFKENAKVVKEIVELLQKYKIRYAQKQQYLSDFFELLLTTGLKQESGQFFTPVPIAQFIIKSLPMDKIIQEKLEKGKENEYLPHIIDYAAGSGHFITEGMHELQRQLEICDINKFFGETKRFIKKANDYPYDWAFDYVYGVEKDYRLVKVGKVGCYLHGDGLANVIHSDGLASFDYKEYKNRLLHKDDKNSMENKQFDIVVSNPPYSVSAFKNSAREYYTEKDFELYNDLTDNSSEIECLFVERTKQLLKDGGVAGVILPSSILSNEGIYTKSREIILKYFEIVAITELGSNTFMATGTNTVVLFLRRRNNYDFEKITTSLNISFNTYQDNTINGIEKPISKYLNKVWENVSFEDYVSMIKNNPNDIIENHEIYKEYQKKIKSKNENVFWSEIVKIEKEKLLYFILAYSQKVVLIKTGEKDTEKRFLGYEFSNRRGSEGIHPIQRGKTIAECTKLFDEERFDNEEKASAYVYKAFSGDYETPIHESLKDNISRVCLVDMLTFDRATFAKNISTAVKKKVKIESKWDIKKIGNIAKINYGTRIVKATEEGTIFPVFGGGGETFKANSFNRENTFIISRFGMSPECVRFVSGKFFLNDSGMTIDSIDNQILNSDYLNYYLFINQEMVYLCGRGVALKNIDIQQFNSLQIPLPPKEIQQKIVSEIEVLEKKEDEAKEEIEKYNVKICNIINNVKGENKKLRELCHYSNNKIDNILLTSKNYIGVDNMLQNTKGKINSNFVPNSETSTAYNLGDVLLSNIRPYLKKIWYADNSGGSSNDVLVLQTVTENIDSKYLFYNLKQDKFFDYEMEGKKGLKMPRGDKQHILDYKIPVPPLSEQQKIVSEVEKIESEIAKLEKQLAEIPQEKEAVLKKYL